MRMINFFYSDCDENQSEISDSSDFIVFPNIKWISSQDLSLTDFYFGLTPGAQDCSESFKYGANLISLFAGVDHIFDCEIFTRI